MPARSMTWRFLMPEACTMKSESDFCSSSAPVPASLAFSASTQALKLSTSSSLVIDASGISTPMPLMMTRCMSNSFAGGGGAALILTPWGGYGVTGFSLAVYATFRRDASPSCPASVADC